MSCGKKKYKADGKIISEMFIFLQTTEENLVQQEGFMGNVIYFVENTKILYVNIYFTMTFTF